MASTAFSSLTKPETIMKGISKPFSFVSSRASKAPKPGKT
jgi:hypothetical protein